LNHPAIQRKANLGRRIWNHRLYYALIIPGIIYFILFCYMPMYGIIIAFKRLPGLITPEAMFTAKWVGFKYFEKFIDSYYFWNVVGNTLAISGLRLLFAFPAPILFALLLNEIRNVKFKKTVQTISYMPHFISMVVLCSLVQILCTTDGGPINAIIEAFGGDPIYFLGDNRYFRGVLVASTIWKELGWGAIIYLAAITGVRDDLIEAAMLDGAGRFRQVIHVIIPAIMPTVSIMLILNVGGIMNAGQEQILLLYSEPVYETADIIDTYIYRSGIQSADYSYSTAVGLFKSIINMILLVSTNFIAKKLGSDGIW